MKKNLKKYNDFINEELTAPPKLSDSYLKSNLDRNNAEIFLILRSNFYDGIVNITDDLRPRSFSDMCKKDSNPEEDYKELQSLMDKKGWDIQSIKNLFSSQVDEICGYDIGDLVSFRYGKRRIGIIIKPMAVYQAYTIPICFSNSHYIGSHNL